MYHGPVSTSVFWSQIVVEGQPEQSVPQFLRVAELPRGAPRAISVSKGKYSASGIDGVRTDVINAGFHIAEIGRIAGHVKRHTVGVDLPRERNERLLTGT